VRLEGIGELKNPMTSSGKVQMLMKNFVKGEDI
jgi:hypothetical protein